MQQEYGTPVELHPGAEVAASTVRIVDGPLDLSWHHCSTTSDFLGDFFATDTTAKNLDHNETRHSICYLVNELLENAVKFRTCGDIVLDTALDGKVFKVRISNLVAKDAAVRFQSVLSEITSRDPGELLIERIEQNALDPSANASGLGLLTLMNDYGVVLGWKFLDAGNGGTVELETHASLTLS